MAKKQHSSNIKECKHPSICGDGSPRRHYKGTVCPPVGSLEELKRASDDFKSGLRGRLSKPVTTIGALKLKMVEVDGSAASLCGAAGTKRYPICKIPTIGDTGRCKKHADKPQAELTLEDVNGWVHIHNAGGDYGTLDFGTDIVHYDYSEKHQEDCDHHYCSDSYLTDMTVKDYSPTAHAVALNPETVENPESFLFAATVYTTEEFSIEQFGLRGEADQYGEVPELDAPEADRALIRDIGNATPEERLAWAGEQIGVDLSNATLGSFKLKELGKEMPGTALKNRSDVALEVPLAVAEMMPNGELKIVWGRENLRQASSIHNKQVESGRKLRRDAPTEVLMYVI